MQNQRSDRQRRRSNVVGGVGALVGLGAALASYAYFHEPLNIELDRLTIRIPSGCGQLPSRGVRILHLSDTHFQGNDQRERAKVARVRRLTAGLDYDLLVHTGDFWHYDRGLRNVEALFDALPDPRLGRYAVLGNHDYTHYAMDEALSRMWRTYWRAVKGQRQGLGTSALFFPWHLLRYIQFVRNTPLDGRRTGFNDANRLTRMLEDRGFLLLHNQAVRLQHARGAGDGIDLFLAGVDDVVEGRPHLFDALKSVPADSPTILLSHNPDILASPRINQVDLVLSGHTHGGQIVLPLWGPAHTQVEHISRQHVAGYFRLGDTQVYITRGLGEGIPLRFNARPQLALITVLGAD